jgi:hypothetical protein
LIVRRARRTIKCYITGKQLMSVFQQVLWGYELTYPDNWVHHKSGVLEGFAAIPEALTPDYNGQNSGQILVRGAWNCSRQSIQPLWNQHIGMLAGWLGAKQVGSAPWRMGGASGIEAEIMLPKKDERRLWTGILERGFLVLYFVTLHLKEERAIFEPMATQIISSLRFPAEVAGVLTSEDGLPLPPGYTPILPQVIVEDITDTKQWRAYEGQSGVDGLQAFYVREARNYGWTIAEYAPYPSPSDLGFARFRLVKDNQQVMLGIMPYSGNEKDQIVGRLVFKL